MKQWGYILAIFYLVISSFTTVKWDDKVIGEYRTSRFNSSSKLSIKANAEFRIEDDLATCFGTGTLRIITGRYRIDDNYVILSPELFRERNYEYKGGVEKITSEQLFGLNKIPKFYDSLLILPWNGNLFLLGIDNYNKDKTSGFAGGQLLSFINDINSGWSGKTKDEMMPFSKPYWNKDCQDCENNINLKELLPKNWQGIVLDSAIHVSIDRIEPYRDTIMHLYQGLVTLKGGSRNRIYQGMVLYPDGKWGCPYSIQIIEVSDSVSKGVTTCTTIDCQRLTSKKMSITDIPRDSLYNLLKR